MSKDPYKEGLFTKNPYAKKSAVTGRLVVVLDSKLDNRGLQLLPVISRAVRRFDIHELIFTDDKGAKPGSTVDKIAYGGFVEIENGGVIVTGDKLYRSENCLGEVAGFDVTHMPNHLNIIIKNEAIDTGLNLGFDLGMELVFR